MLKIPSDRPVVENERSFTWFDDNGILYSISKKARAATLEETKVSIEEFKKRVGYKKICMLIDVTNTAESTREVREFASRELPALVKAIAMVSDSAVGKMLANLFFTIKSQPYPTKVFNDERSAVEWLKQFNNI